MELEYFLTSIVPLLGLCISFLVVILLIRRKFHFGLSLCIGSTILGIASLGRISVVDMVNAFTRAIIIDVYTHELTVKTIELAVLMILIFMLAKTMKETGAINRLVRSIKSIFSAGITIGIIPAIYGLMPVPGGALFSAPMVNREGDKLGLTIDQQNFINVWFRHIWFPIYPISSAMILICSKDFTGLSYDIELYQIIFANLVSFVVFILIGSVYLRRFIKKRDDDSNRGNRDLSGLKFFIIPIVPILLYIFIYIFNMIVPFIVVQEFQNIIFIIGVLGSFLVLFFLSKMSLRQYGNIVKESRSLHIAYAIFGIFIFREMFEVTQVNMLLSNLINGLPISPLLIIIMIPCLLGMITGYNLGAIALSYVVIQPFFVLTPISIIGLTSIIFMSSFVGYLISPIHLCNVVSSDHFKTDTTRMYKMYFPAVLILLIIHTIFIFMWYST